MVGTGAPSFGAQSAALRLSRSAFSGCSSNHLPTNQHIGTMRFVGRRLDVGDGVLDEFGRVAVAAVLRDRVRVRERHSVAVHPVVEHAHELAADVHRVAVLVGLVAELVVHAAIMLPRGRSPRPRGMHDGGQRCRDTMTTIGIIGAGNIGSQLARLAVQNGHQVVDRELPRPGDPDRPGHGARRPAHAQSTRDEAAAAGELVVVTMPLAAIETIPVEPLVGKVVIDTNNYYWERDGHIAALDDESTTTAELLQDHLPGARVVKAFNHIGAADLTGHATPAGTPDRRALVVAGDDAEAKQIVDRAASTRSASTSSTPGPSPRAGASSGTPPATARV